MKVPAAIDHLIIPIRIVVVAALLYAIGHAVWFFVFGADNEERDPDSLRVFSMPTKVSVDDIIDANLFGELPKEEIAPVIEETSLNLKLVGISYNEASPSRSRAFIVGRTKAKVVGLSVGQRVDGVEISDIFEDHVLLLRSGRKESLYVEQRRQLINPVEETTLESEPPTLADVLVAQADVSRTSDSVEAIETTQAGWVRRYYDTHRKRIEEKPNEVLNELGITPVEDESAAGYRLETAMADRLGLRTGDILVSVNGHTVGNIQEDLVNFKEHLEAESLKLEVQRGQTTLTLNYKPNK